MEPYVQNFMMQIKNSRQRKRIDFYKSLFNKNDFWEEAKSKITKWDILSFYFCNKEQTAFCEWDFECVSNDMLMLCQESVW